MANVTTRSSERSSLPARWDPLRELEEVRERMDDRLLQADPPAVRRDDVTVDADNVEAELDDGVLTVRIPKPARAQARRIEVKGG